MQEVKLNLGCGRNLLEGWINIDSSPSALLNKFPSVKNLLFRLKVINISHLEAEWSKDILWKDVRKGLPYSSNSVDKIYSSHMLEHLDRESGERVIRECFRVLKDGGLFRLVVPDLAYHAQRYIQLISDLESVGREPHDDFLFNMYGAYLDRRRDGSWHRYMYDWPTLRTMLREIGFRQVIKQSYRDGVDIESASLDNRPEDSLHIDALK